MTPRLAWPLAVLLMLAALLWPAFWNGFPIIFADTGGYLERPFAGDLVMGRSALYGAFLALGLKLDFWPNIAAQAALTIWILRLTLRAHGLGGRPWLAAAIVIALCVLTALPFYVSQLMPDCLAPLAVLALHLLAFRRETLGGTEIVGLAAIMAFAIASHMATLALCFALLLAFAILRVAAGRLALWRPAFPAPLLAVGAGIGLALLSNLAITGQFAFTPGGTSFLFGRLIQDGIVKRYLTERCPDPSIRLCAYRNELPKSADDWLWGNSPFHQLGGDDGYASEERRIILDTLRLYPGTHLAVAAQAAFDQFFLLKTTASVSQPHNAFVLKTFEQLAPELMPRLRAARQQQPDGFELAPKTMQWLRAPIQENDAFAFVPFNLLHVPVAFLAIAMLPVIIVLGIRRRLQPEAATLATTIGLVLLANAAIAGVFSNPVDRYQSRLVWLALFAVFVAFLTRSRRLV